MHLFDEKESVDSERGALYLGVSGLCEVEWLNNVHFEMPMKIHEL